MTDMWVSSAQGARGHFMAVISYIPRTPWQVLLVLFFVFVCVIHFPTDFPPFILIQSSQSAFGFSLLDKDASI